MGDRGEGEWGEGGLRVLSVIRAAQNGQCLEDTFWEGRVLRSRYLCDFRSKEQNKCSRRILARHTPVLQLKRLGRVSLTADCIVQNAKHLFRNLFSWAPLLITESGISRYLD